ncbi:MAG: hypothetical protein KKF12_05370 [Proteobacteria bacterium]|nr:hypothetical protein [Desulfobacula sp.]MBU3953677.1 hypothetical protein [Pseudomonadota bacterium]MBU4130229.1 hypothetical protein [Pseudomonadota bacterium]
MNGPDKTKPLYQVDDFLDMHQKIQKMKALALALESDAEGFPGIGKNVKRVLASIKMMEFNLCDLISFDLISPDLISPGKDKAHPKKR